MAKEVKFIDCGMLPIHLGFCDSPKAYYTLMEDLKIDDPPPFPVGAGSCNSFENLAGQLGCIICVNKKHGKGKSKLENMCLVVHEAVHVFQAIKIYMDEPNPSPEFESYCIQWIAQRCCEELKIF